MRFLCTLLLPTVALGGSVCAQFTNISCTEPIALEAMKGQHDPAQYAASVVIDDHEEIICALRSEVDPDSLRANLERIVGFGTRNTYSDTLSATSGIGAARRWAHERFAAISVANEGRLIPAYLKFDYANEPQNCGDGYGWRDVLAVLPGSSTQGHRVVLIEAHIDSRCSDTCDPTCDANGAEDNGSGSALVLELARVLSRYTFKHTLVFALVTGEEQGLLGARALAQFCSQQGIAIKAVLNNDIVGGILCGHTASPPGCGVVDEVDSLQFRVFSHGSTRGLARMIRLGYEEKLQAHVPVPMLLSVMDREDRISRGSDHIPFRQAGFQSIRFTAANEHGDGDPSEPGYDDRQHTSDDVLGVDTDGDAVIDSFYVDFNYLARNAVINGMSATLLAHGPETPAYTIVDEPTGLRVQITGNGDWSEFRVGVRGLTSPQTFDALYRTDQTSFLVPGLEANHAYYVSVAGVDTQGITSIFGAEQVRANDADTPPMSVDDLPFGLNCMPIGIAEQAQASLGTIKVSPDPFVGRALLRWSTNGVAVPNGLFVVITDMQGRELRRVRISGTEGSWEYTHQHGAGLYLCRLMADGRAIATARMLAAD